MTPKEKAEELVEKFKNEIKPIVPDDNSKYFVSSIRNILAKQCALIAVDEIEKALTEYGKTTHELQNMDSEFRFWDSVKTEIKNL